MIRCSCASEHSSQKTQMRMTEVVDRESGCEGGMLVAEVIKLVVRVTMMNFMIS